MIRSHTPLPRRPAQEAELLDVVLEAFAPNDVLRHRVLTSHQVVAFVKYHKPAVAAVDVRMMLAPPYFQLTDRGWICRWLLR